MHRFNRLPCVLFNVAVIVALHHMTSFDTSKMAVITSIKVKASPFSTSQICYSPAHYPYHIDGAVLCHLLGEQSYPFEITDINYID